MPDREDVKFFVRKALMGDRFKWHLDRVYEEKRYLYGDTLVVHYPVEVFTHPKWDVGTMFPYGEIDSPISRNMAVDSVGLKRLMHDVQIFWHVRHDDEEELDKHIGRYLRATRDYFEENLYLGDLGNAPITLNDDVYSPFVPVNLYNARPFVKTGLLTIYVETYG